MVMTCHTGHTCRPGKMRFTTGTYRITKQLVIPNRLVLRGAGRGKTTLLFPFPLSTVYGLEERPEGTTEYTRGRFWIQYEGIDRWFEDRCAEKGADVGVQGRPAVPLCPHSINSYIYHPSSTLPTQMHHTTSGPTPPSPISDTILPLWPVTASGVTPSCGWMT